MNIFVYFGIIFTLHLFNVSLVYGKRPIGRAALTYVVVHSCPSLIYCQGDLLHTVQSQKLNNDSKTFVDMSQKNDAVVTLENFKKMMDDAKNNPSRDTIKQFVDQNFEFVDESENWTPTDQTTTPSFLDKIEDYKVKQFAQKLVSLWPLLGRKVKESVSAHEDRHSLVPVPNGFIVPGGRFREIYYWDSYWIVKGLLISEMYNTVKGMLENFIYLIKKFGLIPNGSRVYYINRSQPPLFTSMVGLYMKYTNDVSWLAENIDYIEAELYFWLEKRTLQLTRDGVDYQLAHYGTDSNTPRPESYAEDLDTCSYVLTQEEKSGCYNALKTAAETGLDFSSRWIFDESGGNNANLSFIDSQRVVPVDLNAILCKSFMLLAEFYDMIGNVIKQNEWLIRARQWQNNIQNFLYNEQDGIWYDYDYMLDQQRPYFYATNFVPLWAGILYNKEEYGRRAYEYFLRNDLTIYEGGIPMSLLLTGEQWDMPNAWPPVQEYVILGLYDSGYKSAQMLARVLAKRWIKANMIGFEQTGEMYEKYDANVPGQYGGGGEYTVQLGFGWSNGVVLGFIDQFSSGYVPRTVLSSYVYVILYLLLYSFAM